MNKINQKILDILSNSNLNILKEYKFQKILKIFFYKKIHLVLIDCDSQLINYIKIVERIKFLNKEIPIILYSKSNDFKINNNLTKINIYNFLDLNKSIDELKLNIFSCIEEIEEQLNINKIFDFIICEKKIFKIPNSFKYVFPVSQFLIKRLFFVGIKDTEKIQNIKFGIEEMVINAIEHGNLEISFCEKTKILENGIDLNDIINDRSNKDVFKKRKVTIKYILTPTKIVYIIKDQGNGFDWKKIIDNSLNETRINLEHGRGIILSKNYFDEFFYNEKGNEVTMIIYRKN